VDEKLTRKSQEALSEAVQMAASAGNPAVDGLHLLAALVQQDGGTAAPLLRAVGADPADVLKKVREQLSRQPQAAGPTVSAPQTSRQLLAALATGTGDVRRVRLDRAPAGGPGHRRRARGRRAA
jgi:ATP-dependent Clp protease ATP-binding subunit ClpB